MKTKKTIAMLVVAVLVLSLGSVAFATASPSAYTATVEEYDSVGEVVLTTVGREDSTALNSSAASYAAEQFGADATVVPLMAVNVNMVGVAVGSEITINVAGAKANDNIYVAVKNASGKMDIVKASCPADGKVTYTVTAFGPTLIFKVATSAVEVTLPQTGDNNSMMTIALIALGCAAVASIACVSLKRSR